MKAVLAGLNLFRYRYCLAIANLQAYAGARPDLAGRVRVAARHYGVGFAGLADARKASIVDDLLGEEPDLVGFSCYVWNIETSLELCRRLKKRLPGARIVLGGPEVSGRAIPLLAEHPEVDYVVCGEGEETFRSLLDRLSREESVEGIAGLAWRRDGRPVREADRPLLSGLDAVPSPILEGLLEPQARDCVVIEGGRGCPFRCKYCDWQNGQPTRVQPVERVLDEVSYVLDRADDVVFDFSDADVFMDLPRAKKLLEGLRLRARGRRCRFMFETYLPRLNGETFRLLDSEVFILGSGVQSIDPAALAAAGRFFDREKIERACLLKRRWAPSAFLQMQLIYGLPEDTRDGCRAAISWALRQRPDQLMLLRHCLLPGSELGRRPLAHGVVAEERPPYRAAATSSFPPQDLDAHDRWVWHFRLLNNDAWITREMARLAEDIRADPLPLWDELIARLRDDADLGSERAYAESDPMDVGFIVGALRWKEGLEANGRAGRLRELAGGFVREAASQGRERRP